MLQVFQILKAIQVLNIGSVLGEQGVRNTQSDPCNLYSYGKFWRNYTTLFILRSLGGLCRLVLECVELRAR
jgi:hypothetical protein